MTEDLRKIDPTSLTYSVTGFRSLRNFKISIVPGLNIITGRNGSGKTNFIEFLDFLSIFIRNGLGAAVSTLGGTNRIFSQEALRSRSPRLIIQVSGLATLPVGPKLHEVQTSTPFFRFDYNLEIRINKQSAKVFIAKECVSFFRLMDDPKSFEEQRVLGKIELNRRLDQDTQSIEGSYSYSPRLLTSSGRNPLRFLARPYLRSREGVKPAQARQDNFDQILSSPDETESLLSNAYPFPAMSAITTALSRSRAFNFLPSQIRKPNNITDSPEIAPDGSGLSAALYHMHYMESRGGRRVFGPRYTPNALAKVVSWSKLLIPELANISANPDLNTGTYQAYLWIESEKSLGQLKLPLHSASDGTLKWLALASKLAQEPSYLTIEEPENFLHPMMQSFLVQMLRENSEDSDGSPNYIILSTHSETIINNCHPREMILFEFSDHKSSCKRISNSDNLISEMNRTGFGLGYYYVANAIS